MNLKRTLAGSATLVVALSLSACGDSGDDAAEAPEAASVEDFCDTFQDMGQFNEEASSDEQAEQANEIGERLEEVGTPEDIPEDAREGFEVMVAVFKDIDGDDVEKLDELQSDDDEATAEALGIETEDVPKIMTFVEYASTTCAEQLMGDAPSPEGVEPPEEDEE